MIFEHINKSLHRNRRVLFMENQSHGVLRRLFNMVRLATCIKYHMAFRFLISKVVSFGDESTIPIASVVEKTAGVRHAE